MSEEDIVKIITYMLNMQNTDVNVIVNYEAIGGLLELYKKQQKELEQVKKFGIPIETLCAEFERLENLEDKTDELKMEIEEKEQTIKILRKTKPIEEVFHDLIKENDYISKDKIREKIKELELMTLDNDIFGQMRNFAILELKQLLGEN